MRDNYLLWLEKYRSEGYDIYYQDETWVNKNLSRLHVWQDVNSNDILYKVLSGRGERCIISHLGSTKNGLLRNCMLMFCGYKCNKMQTIILKWIALCSNISYRRKFFRPSKKLEKMCSCSWSCDLPHKAYRESLPSASVIYKKISVNGYHKMGRSSPAIGRWLTDLEENYQKFIVGICENPGSCFFQQNFNAFCCSFRAKSHWIGLGVYEKQFLFRNFEFRMAAVKACAANSLDQVSPAMFFKFSDQ